MHSELDRLKADFGWSNPLTEHEQVPSLFCSTVSLSVSTAYSDSHTQERADLDRRSWWYQTRNRIISRALQHELPPSAIWDIGSGTGVVASALQSAGHQVICIEPSIAGAQMTACSGILTFNSTLEQAGLPSCSIKAVSLFDVLEHVDNRRGLLHEIHRVLQPDGYLVLTVPALHILWSQFDVDDGHRLRYSKSSLQNELAAAGFKVVQSGYFFVLTVLPLLLLRALPYRLGVRRALATEATLAAEGGVFGRIAGWIERRLAMRVPFGSSLLVVARKPEA